MIDYDAPGVYELMAETRDCINRGVQHDVEKHLYRLRVGEAIMAANVALGAAFVAGATGYDSDVQSFGEMSTQWTFYGMATIAAAGAVATAGLLADAVKHRFNAWLTD